MGRTLALVILFLFVLLSVVGCTTPERGVSLVTDILNAITGTPLTGAVHYDQNSQTWLFHGGASWVIRWTERSDGLFDYRQFSVCNGTEVEQGTGANYTRDELWEKVIIRFAQSGVDNKWLDYKTTEGTFRRALCN